MTDEHPDTEDPQTLVEMATRGEMPAVESLLQRYLPDLRAYIRLRSTKAVREKESSSDLAQSVCREVLEKMDDFDYRGEAAFRGWLYAKALSKVQDRAKYYKAQRRDVGREQRVDSALTSNPGVHYAHMLTPSMVAMGRETNERIERAFDELPDDYREVLTHLRVARLSYAETAEAMGRSEGSIRGLAERALVRLAWTLTGKKDARKKDAGRDAAKNKGEASD